MKKDKIIFFHMNQLGDLLFSLPLIKSARCQWPDKELCSFVRRPLAGLLEGQGLIDKIVYKENSFFRNFRTLKHLGKISKAILLSESPESLLMAWLQGSGVRYGFRTSSLENNARQAQSCGLTGLPNDYSGILKIPSNYERSADKFFFDRSIDKDRSIAFGMGASRRRKGKTWPLEKWEELITELVNKGFYCLIMAAPSELNFLGTFVRSFERNVHLCSSAGSLMETASVVSSSRLFVGTDSGAMHLAAALGVRVISLFGETDPSQVGPRPANRHIIISNSQIRDISAGQVLSLIISNFN
jgi:ADP-heptose:LPS heptosyltransferase